MAADKTIQEWAQLKSLASTDDAAVMQEGGYVLTYSTIYTGNARVYGIQVPLNEESWTKEKIKELRKGMKKTAAVQYIKGGLLQVTVNAMSKKGRLEKFQQATDALLAALPAQGLEPSNVCKYCGQPAPDDLALQENAYYPAHTRCKDEKAEEILNQVEQNEMHGSILLGLVGAILGGIVGCIPTFITAHFMDTIYALLFALIPLASYTGYRLLKGIMNTAVPFIISLISLVCTFVLVMGYNYAFFVAEVGEYLVAMGISPFGLFMEYAFGEGLGDLVTEMAMPFLFCIIGIVVAWSYISKNNNHRLKEVQKLRQPIAK